MQHWPVFIVFIFKGMAALSRSIKSYLYEKHRLINEALSASEASFPNDVNRYGQIESKFESNSKFLRYLQRLNKAVIWLDVKSGSVWSLE